MGLNLLERLERSTIGRKLQADFDNETLAKRKAAAGERKSPSPGSPIRHLGGHGQAVRRGVPKGICRPLHICLILRDQFHSIQAVPKDVFWYSLTGFAGDPKLTPLLGLHP